LQAKENILENMANRYNIPNLPLPYDLETVRILKQLSKANRKLAELKGIARTIPNENILISTLTLQEARDSSAVENIVTTQDDLYKAGLSDKRIVLNPATKEVLRYREAIFEGFKMVRKNKILSNNVIKKVQELVKLNDAGFLVSPSKALVNQNDGKIIYTPPQDIDEVNRKMENLELFINDPDICNLDPLIKMAIIHHQFESIHPFGDGNGRTGRIINILYLVITDLLDIPILYLSRYITHNKNEYYALLQAIRDKNHYNAKEWEDWIVFMLKGVEETATDTIELVKGISQLMAEYKTILRPLFAKAYKHELINNLFFHPYTKIDYMQHDMMVQRKTASKYLDKIVEVGLLEKLKIGRENYYINTRLRNLFLNYSDLMDHNGDAIESIIK
jgi:Fic family protein